MQESINLSVTPFQAVMALALQVWIIVIFPIMIMRKIDHLTNLLEDHLGASTPEEPDQGADNGNEEA